MACLWLAPGVAERGGARAIARHDARLREALLLANGLVVVEEPLGERPEVLGELRVRAIPARVHVPYGDDWLRYRLWRLVESAPVSCCG